MTLTKRRQLQQRQTTRWLSRWLLLFTSITSALLLSAVIVFAGLRWYWLWSVQETRKEWEQEVKKWDQEWEREQADEKAAEKAKK